jgi:N-acyl-D-aspartate/D-glutamate deacylase
MLAESDFLKRGLALSLARLLFLFVCVSALLPGQTYDLLITGGRVLDGAGNPWFRGDIAIQGDRIAAMGHLPGASARRTINAGGHIVAPGFIDTHNHSRGAIFDVPGCENFIRQGVTTVIEGNDGGSPLPLRPFFEKYREAGIALNLASFIGHGSIRREVIGAGDRAPTPEELEQMKNLVRRAMEQGALGVSTGEGKASGWG